MSGSLNITGSLNVTEGVEGIQKIVVTVVNDGGNKYQINGLSAPRLTLNRAQTYRFDLSDSSNSNHPLVFKRGTGGSSYTTNVTSSGTPGNDFAYVQIKTGFETPPELYYYCSVHGEGMGNIVEVESAFTGSHSGSFSGSFQGDGSSLTKLVPTTGSTSISGSIEISGSTFISSSHALSLAPSNPLPSGVASGSLAVTGSNLAFYDGTSWKKVTIGSF
tara:strand:+ start:3 stop:656 length:654 start_codon:yes stop_codon:yes gene_type:complete